MPLSLLLHSDEQAGAKKRGGDGQGGGSGSAKERQSSIDSQALLSPDSSEASHGPSSWFRRSSSPSSATAATREGGAGDDDTRARYAHDHNPMFPATDSAAMSAQPRDPLGRKQPAALPSYLKIPTLIPSTYASPTSSASASPPGMEEYDDRYKEELSSYDDDDTSIDPRSQSHASSSSSSQQNGPRLRFSGKAAEAILSTQEVVLAPGEAGKVSNSNSNSPLLPSEADSSLELEGDGKDYFGAPSIASSTDDSAPERSTTSRTPTPTPGNLGSTRTMTPTDAKPNPLSSIHSPAHVAAAIARTTQDGGRRASLQMYTGGTESGTATPALPIGLTSAPSSALTPAIPTYNADGGQVTAVTPSTPLTKETNNLSLTLPPQTTPTGREVATPRQSTVHAAPPSYTRSSSSRTRQQVPLIPIQIVWRDGGKEVFVTGTFANEWRSKILLRKNPKSSGRRPEYTCVLHLAPGTHRLKFIVDDRWRVSRDLSTASDGEGNLTNYIEVAHTGPAHPGPLSAPGEDLLAAPDDDDEKKRHTITGHKATNDLQEEARRAEALLRGSLLDVFGDEDVQKEERWTQEIPPSIIEAQAAEEAYRNEMEARAEQHPHDQSKSKERPSEVPVPPTLPRQLEKVILNSTSASVMGTVDDNSVLPAPNHAILHHLTASAIKSGVIATGCTVRYRKKYITTVYYRAAS